MDIKKQLKKHKEELINLLPQIKNKKRKSFIEDTIDIIELQINEDYNSNDLVICKLAESITNSLKLFCK